MRNELWKLFGKKRTYIGFGAFLIVQNAMLLLFRYTKWHLNAERLLAGNGYLAESYISALTVAVFMFHVPPAWSISLVTAMEDPWLLNVPPFNVQDPFTVSVEVRALKTPAAWLNPPSVNAALEVSTVPVVTVMTSLTVIAPVAV